jgi:hypothetical protein
VAEAEHNDTVEHGDHAMIDGNRPFQNRIACLSAKHLRF